MITSLARTAIALFLAVAGLLVVGVTASPVTNAQVSCSTTLSGAVDVYNYGGPGAEATFPGGGATADSYDMQNGSQFRVTTGLQNTTVDADLCIDGVDVTIVQSVGFGPLNVLPAHNVTFTGDVYITNGGTLSTRNYGGNIIFQNVIVAGTGGTAESTYGDTITREIGSYGDLTVNGLKFEDVDRSTVSYSTDETGTPYDVDNYEEANVTGIIGDVSVYATGRLTGDGTVGNLSVLEYATLAPGNSPGCLSSGNLSFTDETSVFEVEIDGSTVCSEYDQQQVTGTVDLGNAKLSLTKSVEYTPTAGTEFIIIENDGSESITGTFRELPEGQEFVKKGVLYSITYVGGDGGNDVVLTALAAEDSETKEITIDTDSDTESDVVVETGQTLVLNGGRGDVTLESGATLKGSGSAGDLVIPAGATFAPGESPGCMSNGNLTLSGTYQVELEGLVACTGYDQDQVTGTVDVSGATLQVTHLNGFETTDDDEFIIVLNDASDAVTGTFSGLAENATFQADGMTYRISYVGGDGNDITLTRVVVPGEPDSGIFSPASAGTTGIFAVIVAVFTLTGSFALAGKRR